MEKKRIFLVLFLIIILGATLRIYDLRAESIWADEAHSLASARGDSVKEVIALVRVHEWNNPPFYYILLHYWTGLFGESEFWSRFFSVLFSVLSIGLVFLIGKEVFNFEVGLISALISSLSIVEIVYAQEARSYALFSFLVLSSVYFFIKILKDDKKSDYWLYFFFSLAMIYTLPFGLAVVLGQNLYLIIFCKEDYGKKIKSWLFSQIALALCFLPELPSFLRMFKINFLGNLVILVEKYDAPTFLKNAFFISLGAAIILILMISLVIYFRKPIRNFFISFSFEKYKNYFLLILILAGGACFLMVPLLTRPFFLTRYTLFLMPFLYLAMAVWIAKLQKPLKTIVVLVIILLSAYALIDYYPETTKDNWRGAANYVEEKAGKDELVLVCAQGLSFKYYFPDDEKVISISPYKDPVELSQKIENKNYWLVFPTNHAKGEICEKLRQQEARIKQTYPGVGVWYIKKES